MDGRQTGKDFLTRLRSGAMRPSFIRIGMAKAGHGDTDSIMFSESETCERWVAVPLDIVQSVEVIGWTACHDHRHPIVKLQLHEPAPDNKMARMLIDLLTANDGASDRGNGTDGAQGFQRGLTRAPQPRIAVDRSCLRSCQQDCKSGPPFLSGPALARCLRSCRRECGFQ